MSILQLYCVKRLIQSTILSERTKSLFRNAMYCVTTLDTGSILHYYCVKILVGKLAF